MTIAPGLPVLMDSTPSRAGDGEASEAHFAVVDVETTGLDPEGNRIVEVAIVEIDRSGRTLGEFSSLVDIPDEDELGAGFIHGITRSTLAGAPSFSHLAGEITSWLAGRIVVGHVVTFDLEHLEREFRTVGIEMPHLEGAMLCTRDAARAVLPPGSHALASCCEATGIAIPDLHSALGDARATARLLLYLLDHGYEPLLEECWQIARTRAWPDIPQRAHRVTKRRVW